MNRTLGNGIAATVTPCRRSMYWLISKEGGHREVLGDLRDDGAGWLAFFRDLTARGSPTNRGPRRSSSTNSAPSGTARSAHLLDWRTISVPYQRSCGWSSRS